MSVSEDERSAGGYSVAYSRDDTHFPVYVTAAMAAMFFAAAWLTGAGSPLSASALVSTSRC